MQSADRKLHPKTLLFATIVILSNLGGNLALSFGLKQPRVVSVLAIPEVLLPFLSPLVWIGIALLILWMFSRMALLSWADLTYVVPVTSVGYVLNVATGYLFLVESVSATRWVGALLIFAGAVVVGLTMPSTTRETSS
jgi:drug/metabolite transporter (DMT)-like permease